MLKKSYKTESHKLSLVSDIGNQKLAKEDAIQLLDMIKIAKRLTENTVWLTISQSIFEVEAMKPIDLSAA